MAQAECMEVAESQSEVYAEPVQLCSAHRVDGVELKLNDEVFFERQDDGILEEGTIVSLLQEGDSKFAICRYKERTWSNDCYNEKKDIERLLLRDQLLNNTRTKRAAHPVLRYQPAKPREPSQAKMKEIEAKRRRRRLRKARRKRRTLRQAKRDLVLRYLLADTDESVKLTDAEEKKLMSLLGVSQGKDIRSALTLSSSEESSTDSSDSSVFPEDESDEETESSEDELDFSDISTDSYISEPELTYWKAVRDPCVAEYKALSRERWEIAPKWDSSDSEDSDEGIHHNGEGASVAICSGSDYAEIALGRPYRERVALLREYMQRTRSRERRVRSGAMSFKEFCLLLRLVAEEHGGVDYVEGCQAIKGVKSCDGRRTMYGAIRAPLIKEMVRLMDLRSTDTFVDIGSGLGTVVLQVAATTGCKARGVELEESRYTMSSVLCADSLNLLTDIGAEAEFVTSLRDRIELIQGDARAYEEKLRESTAIYFNNHGVWFDETTSKKGELSVEHWVAKLFAKTKVGTRLVLLKQMPHLKGDWFKEEKYIAPHAFLTWARDDKPLYVYTKLKSTWTCPRCSLENEIVRDDQDIWELRCWNNCASRARLRTRTSD